MSIERGSLLFNTGRHEAAEQEFRAALGQDPSSALAHAMLGLCLSYRKEYAAATEEAQQAIGLKPDWHVGYAALAEIMRDRERFKEAAGAIGEAIRIDAFNAQYYAVLADIRLRQRKWSEALAAANEGLRINPDNQGCLNTRATALVNLGRREEAGVTIEGALRKNPENANTHANQGWALLHAGEHRKAMEHFREALRLKPDMQFARAGLVEALKARNIVYRLMLKYFLFMSRLDRRVQWGIIVGGYLGCRALLGLKDDHPEWAGWIWPLVIAYSIFAIMTWIATPLFNLMLRLDPFGRHALSRDQTVGANCVGVAIAAALAFVAAGLVTGHFIYYMAAIVCGFLVLPLSAVFICKAGWPRTAMAGYTGLVALVGAALVATWVVSGVRWGAEDSVLALRDRLLTVFLFGIFLNGWVANGLMMMRVKK
jgi:Tfp pilus assembly protein PilF